MIKLQSNKEVKFIRHINRGPGKVISQESENITIHFVKPNGIFEDSIVNYQLTDWKIKIIPDNSLGALFIINPGNILSLIDNHDPLVIELLLKESTGTSSLADIKTVFQPLLSQRKTEWKIWWKKTAQRIKTYKNIKYNAKLKEYFITEQSLDTDNLDKFILSVLQSSDIFELANLSQIIIKRLPELKELSIGITNNLWNHLLKALNINSPEGRWATGLLALGEVLSTILGLKKIWINVLREWVGETEVNLLGIRDADVRVFALKAVNRITWNQKLKTLSTYIINEESGEKNRKFAVNLLWSTCKNNSQDFFYSLIDGVRTSEVGSKVNLEHIEPRAKRILTSIIELLNNIKLNDSIELFCQGSIRLLTTIFLNSFNPPLDYGPTEAILNIWADWKKKVDNILLHDNRYISWNSLIYLFRLSSNAALVKYLREYKQFDIWIEAIFNNLLYLANKNNFEQADVMFQTLTYLISLDDVKNRIKIVLQEGNFKGREAQEWALSISIGEESIAKISKEGFSGNIPSVKEQELIRELANLCVLTKIREGLISKAIDKFKELSRFYEPMHLQMGNDLDSFMQILNIRIKEIMELTSMEFFGKNGAIEQYNPSRHHLIENGPYSPKFVEIISIGILKKQKEGPPLILQKAIVKTLNGANL